MVKNAYMIIRCKGLNIIGLLPLDLYADILDSMTDEKKINDVVREFIEHGQTGELKLFKDVGLLDLPENNPLILVDNETGLYFYRLYETGRIEPLTSQINADIGKMNAETEQNINYLETKYKRLKACREEIRKAEM